MFRFKKLQEHHLPKVLAWRTSEHVSRHMHTQVENDLEKQRQWFKNKAQQGYWVICIDDKEVGVINLAPGPEPVNPSWGYYIGEKDYLVFGGLIPPYFYNHVFKNPLVDRIWADVEPENPIIRTHRAHGYKSCGVFGGLDRMFLDRQTWLSKPSWARLSADFE